MSDFVRWNSQPLSEWTELHAPGKIIELDGHITHYIEKGEGDPVILIHGFFYDSFMWNKNIDALAEHFKVYAIDLWGCGYSCRDNLDFGYHLYAQQIKLFMDFLGIDKASLIGQSMGGGTIIQFAINNPDRINKVILVDSAGLPNPTPLTVKFFNLPWIGEYFLGLNNNFTRKQGLIDFFIYDKNMVTDNYVEEVTRSHKIFGSIQTSLNIQRKEFFDKLLQEINEFAKLTIPCLIIWGGNDKAIPLGQGLKLHKIIKNSRLEVIGNAGHVPNCEKSQEFNQLALSFLGPNE